LFDILDFWRRGRLACPILGHEETVDNVWWRSSSGLDYENIKMGSPIPSASARICLNPCVISGSVVSKQSNHTFVTPLATIARPGVYVVAPFVAKPSGSAVALATVVATTK
jgi:hypothetical protein